MENVDLELKRTQLAREKIALEKDLRQKARRDMWVNAPQRSLQRILSSLGRVTRWTVSFCKEWWLAFAGSALALGIGFGLVMWVMTTNEAKREAAKQRYNAAADEYVQNKCVPAGCKFGSTRYESGCFNSWIEEPRCKREGYEEFPKIWDARKKSP